MVDSHTSFTVFLQLDKNRNENAKPAQIVRNFQWEPSHSPDLFVQTQPLEVLPWGTAALGLWLGCRCRAASDGFLVKCEVWALKFEV